MTEAPVSVHVGFIEEAEDCIKYANPIPKLFPATEPA